MERNIPIYKAIIDDEDINSGVYTMSLVEAPAIMVDFVTLSAQENKFQFKLQSAEKQILAGPFLIPNMLIYRNDKENGEYYLKWDEPVIEKTAQRFMELKNQDQINQDHSSSNYVEDAYIVESWIIEDPEKDKSALYGFNLPKGTWFGLVKINNSTYWKDYVKTGKVKGFSIEGYYEFQKVEQTRHQLSQDDLLIQQLKQLLNEEE